MAELNERIAWFQGDDFNLDEAKQRFIEARELSKKNYCHVGRYAT